MCINAGHIYIGTSGYQYDHWRGTFYPEKMPKRAWFAHYTAHFETVEINNTFYNLPSEKTFRAWADAAPSGFHFTLKFSRFATHMKKLKDPDNSIPKFLERAELLGGHLGPILVQLPPNWGVNPERLDTFFAYAPAKHRWAVELRDADWFRDEVYDVLRKHGVALVVHDMIANHPRVHTADWTYERFHGGDYTQPYTHQALTAAAQRFMEYRDAGHDVYVYFNNDAEGYAVANAHDLRRYVRQIEDANTD
ncbi:MAG: DUF72 domain-containing protein [Candidatus Hydrogenedentota bacterium]